MKQEYIKKLADTRDICKERLKKAGLQVELADEEIGLKISLTQFGLSTIYATLSQEEIEYIVDNEVEL